jgi:hypothetical protein
MFLHPLLVAALSFSAGIPSAPSDYFAIRVVDDETGRGVPLVELRTVNHVSYYTDSAGWIAVYEPGLMNTAVFFHVASHGYQYPADGFGYRGTRLVLTPGGTATVKIKRLNAAERLYRVTGGGIYRDSLLLGKPVPTRHPVLNALVFGQDSVVNTVYRDRIYWFWGDTSWPQYPLGNFQVAGATSRRPIDGGLPPSVGVDLEYFVDEKGFAKQMAPVPGQGPTWIDGLVTLRDKAGRERMFAVYAKVRSDMSAKGRGFLEFDDATEQFKRIGEFDPKAPLQPGGHTLVHSDGDTRYIYYTRPFPVVRVPADADAIVDPARYECYTCLVPGSDMESPKLDRDADGRLRWSWKRRAPPLIPRVQEKLIQDGVMKLEESRHRLYDVESGKPVLVHGGSVYWNEYRNRWVFIASEIFGTSMLGEIWLAEADSPIGPWRYAKKVVSHEQYSFYNPKQHPMFDEDGGRVIYFEGTYTDTFSGNTDHTPRYNYNQIMYRLDLADARAVLPVPVYADEGGAGLRVGADAGSAGLAAREPLFFVLDRPGPGSFPVVESQVADGSSVLHMSIGKYADRDPPRFHALPADMEAPPPTSALLYAYTGSDGHRLYRLENAPGLQEYKRASIPLCRVWRDPRRMAND